jgi:hypothetical protein
MTDITADELAVINEASKDACALVIAYRRHDHVGVTSLLQAQTRQSTVALVASLAALVNGSVEVRCRATDEDPDVVLRGLAECIATSDLSQPHD